MNKKSISQRVRRINNPKDKLALVQEWVSQRQSDFFSAFEQLEYAVGVDDLQQIHEAMDKIKDIAIKNYKAMPNIAEAMLVSKHYTVDLDEYEQEK
ncbi:hypothetical protein B0181_04970 [Moraxella caviae]|uniref:Uncharacterized protein n=1 Tax=Moraxella caviae TaxID=34060 RepID=A0A1T0A397_9GAMM|nr:hypothetical protein [Moraxella caviae]OOR90226.1 hypothetical protein B0181_04970 [Moraxella caviae]STZ14553.1 Uncharacterised protein [Moraxella caviae]VEW12558.1 Uncharacterised protein [Moraxella caviae]